MSHIATFEIDEGSPYRARCTVCGLVAFVEFAGKSRLRFKTRVYVWSDDGKRKLNPNKIKCTTQQSIRGLLEPDAPGLSPRGGVAVTSVVQAEKRAERIATMVVSSWGSIDAWKALYQSVRLAVLTVDGFPLIRDETDRVIRELTGAIDAAAAPARIERSGEEKP